MKLKWITYNGLVRQEKCGFDGEATEIFTDILNKTLYQSAEIKMKSEEKKY